MHGFRWRSREGDAACGPRGWREAGFTLLEVLVAVAILAALTAIVPRSLVQARAIVNRSESWTNARLVAEAVLHQELAGPGLRAGTRRGSFGGRAWTAAIVPNATLAAGGGGANARVLFQVRLTVQVSPTETLRVETLRIGGG